MSREYKLDGAVRKPGDRSVLLNVGGDGIRFLDQPGLELKLDDPITVGDDGSVFWKNIRLERIYDE